MAFLNRQGKPLPKTEQKFENFVRSSFKISDKKVSGHQSLIHYWYIYWLQMVWRDGSFHHIDYTHVLLLLICACISSVGVGGSLGVCSHEHIYVNLYFIFESSLPRWKNPECAIVAHTAPLPSPVHYASELRPAQSALLELYSFCVGGLLWDGTGVYLPAQLFLSDLLDCVSFVALMRGLVVCGWYQSLSHSRPLSNPTTTTPTHKKGFLKRST